MADVFARMIDAHRDAAFYTLSGVAIGCVLATWAFAVNAIMKTIIDWRKQFPKKPKW